MKALAIAATALLLFTGCASVAAKLDPSLSCIGKCGLKSAFSFDYCYCKDTRAIGKRSSSHLMQPPGIGCVCPQAMTSAPLTEVSWAAEAYRLSLLLLDAKTSPP